MVTITILPDFNKLSGYFPLSDPQSMQLKDSEGIKINLRYFSQDGYTRLTEGLNQLLTQYNLCEHFHNILYIVVNKAEEIEAIFERMLNDHDQSNASKQLASLLLLYKDNGTNSQLQFTAKSLTQTSHVKDSGLVSWMLQTIYNAVESKDFPMDEMGLRIMNDLFGDDPFTTNEISIARLREAANQKVHQPSIIPLQTEMCLHLKQYLIEHSEMDVSDGKNMTDKQANFLFDILELLGYVDREKVSVPKDYMYARFANYHNRK